MMLTSFLSTRGKRIQWPKKGILQQTADAKQTELDATIGIALEEDGMPMHLSSMETAIEPRHCFPYAPGFGVKALREEWKREIAKKNPGLKATISLPVVTAGLTHGLSVIGSLFVDEGDEILLPDLFWGNYSLIFEHNYGAKLRTFETFKEGFNLEAFEQALASRARKKIVLLNFPNNPTGYAPTEEEAEKILTIINKKAAEGDKIVVLLDDAYFGLVYEDDIVQESIFSQLSNQHKNILAVKIDGATKEEFAWGFRIGFLTYGGKALTKEDLLLLEEKTAATIRASVSNCSHLAQTMLLRALSDHGHENEKKKKFLVLKRRYEKVKTILSDSKYASAFTALPFNSGYFMCLKLRDGLDAETLRQKLLSEHSTGVVSLPGNMLRIAYSGVPTEKLEQLFENILKACK
jgi:aspartate/methionine/tyrosine aminotransferase